MTAQNTANALHSTLRDLTETGLVPALGERLNRTADLMIAELGDTVVNDIPAFSESANPDIFPELWQHARLHAETIERLLRGGLLCDFAFVRHHAERRAEQRFPLESVLHAYRCGHKVVSRWIRTAAASIDRENASQNTELVADFTMEYTDVISTIAAQTYVAHVRLLSEVAGDERARLMNILLNGFDESDGRVATTLRKAGYLDKRQSFCVALIQPVDPSEMQHPERARRLVDSVDRTLTNSDVRRIIDIHNDSVTIVFSFLRRTSGWTKQRTSLADKVSAELMKVGLAVLIGVSNDVPSTSHIPGARREAELALSLANTAHRVTQFSEIPVRKLVTHIAGERIHPVLPVWSKKLIDADRSTKGTLVATLRAYAEADMNVLRTGEALGIHANTVYARLQRIESATSLDARRYHDLTELLLTLECIDANRNKPDARLPESG